jgi:hypothetical protein
MKVIATIKIRENGQTIIKALPSNREAVRATLEFVLWWLNHTSASSAPACRSKCNETIKH